MLRSAFVCFALVSFAACISEVNRHASTNSNWGSKSSSLANLFFLNVPPQLNASNWNIFGQKQKKEASSATTPKPWRLPSIFPFNIGKNSSNKIFNSAQTVSKFPPVVEFLVQKIQASQSNYVYEDLSRPPTYDKPVFTLSPEDQVAFGLATSTKPPSTPKPISNDDFDYEEIANSTETLFEIIKSPKGNKVPISSDLKSICANYCKPLANDSLQTPNFMNKDKVATSETEVGPVVVLLRRKLDNDKAGTRVDKICSEMLKKTQEIAEGPIHNEAPTNVVYLSKGPVTQDDVFSKEDSRTPMNHHGLPNVVYQAEKDPIRSNQAQKGDHGMPHLIFLRRLKESPNTQV